MIDLDVSERVCDVLIEHELGCLPPAGIGNSVSIKELITRLRQAEKDAARYSFIKKWNQSYSLNVYRKDIWDEVIDKAMWMESQCNK